MAGGASKRPRDVVPTRKLWPRHLESLDVLSEDVLLNAGHCDGDDSVRTLSVLSTHVRASLRL